MSLDVPVASDHQVQGTFRRALGVACEKVNIPGIAGAARLLIDPSFARPTLVRPTLAHITPEELREELGIRAVICDIDGTLCAEGENAIDPRILPTIERIRTDMALVFLTNKVAPRNRIMEERHGIPVIDGIQKKPHPAPYQRALTMLREVAQDEGLLPQHVLMVGDSFSTDNLGAIRFGMPSLLVHHRRLYRSPYEKILTKYPGRALDALCRRRLGISFSD